MVAQYTSAPYLSAREDGSRRARMVRTGTGSGKGVEGSPQTRATSPALSPKGRARGGQKGTRRTRVTVPTTQQFRADRRTGTIGAGGQGPASGRASGRRRPSRRPVGHPTPRPEAAALDVTAGRGLRARPESAGSRSVLFSPGAEDAQARPPVRPGARPALRRCRSPAAGSARPASIQISQGRRPVTRSVLRLGREVECRWPRPPVASGPPKARPAELKATRAKVNSGSDEDGTNSVPRNPTAGRPGAPASPGSPRRRRPGDDCLMYQNDRGGQLPGGVRTPYPPHSSRPPCSMNWIGFNNAKRLADPYSAGLSY
jgi:hypothetical protein